MQKIILLIDDDQDEYIILKQALKISGLSFRCEWAESALKAQYMLQQMLPGLILLDYNMPQVNGIECLKQIRAMPNVATVPIVMYSHTISNITRELALSQGAQCLEKPCSINQTVQSLVRLLGNQSVASFR